MSVGSFDEQVVPFVFGECAPRAGFVFSYLVVDTPVGISILAGEVVFSIVSGLVVCSGCIGGVGFVNLCPAHPAACAPSEHINPSVVVDIDGAVVTVMHCPGDIVVVVGIGLSVPYTDDVPLVFGKSPCTRQCLTVSALVCTGCRIVLEITRRERDLLLVTDAEQAYSCIVLLYSVKREDMGKVLPLFGVFICLY